MENSFAKLVGETDDFDSVLRSTKGRDIGIGGKGALDKINTEETVRSRRQSFDVKDGTDSSVENGRSHGFEGIGTKGDGGFHGVGGLSCHMRVFLLIAFLISVTCTIICRCIASCLYHINFHCSLH